MRRPATLLPAPAARLIGFALLAGLGALEWRRMVESLSAGRALLWVGVALAAALGLLAAERHRHRLALPGAAVAGLAAALATSGIDLRLLAPKRWPELGEGLVRGAEALGGARLPYGGTDPWPAETLELSGAALVLVSAYLAFWPRSGGRGSPLSALAPLLALVVTPVVAMSTPAPLVLGAAAACVTACFLFLERLPARSGLGAAGFAAAAVAVALPLGAAADREDPWFDYQAFAESLGPLEPVEFTWEHGYGPIDWPRDGRELFRARSEEPLYWKAETLNGFRADRWMPAARPSDGGAPVADLAESFRERPGWNERAEVVLRRLETRTLVGPGTILRMENAGRGVRAEPSPGRWVASRELGRGDSYTVEAHVPRPTAEQLGATMAGSGGRQAGALRLTLPLREAPLGPPAEVTVAFPEFALNGPDGIGPEVVDGAGTGPGALRRTSYGRTWRLARRLRRESDGPWDYVLRVNAFLRRNGFRYSERPPAPAPGVPPLEAFLHEDRAGYCQQFSGAMALLLRMGGVPARVAAGFTPGGFRKSRGEWVIRDFDAHSWVEVWLDDVGWVTVDPTPPATPARSQTAALAVPEYLEETEAVPPGATGARSRLDRDPKRPAAAAAPSGADSSADGTPLVLLLGALGAVVAIAVAVARHRRAAPAADTDDGLAELERALRRSGRPVAPGTTLAELERRLGGSAYVRALRTARYGGRRTVPTANDRARLRRELAAGMGWRGRLRGLWAVPPRVGAASSGGRWRRGD